MIRRNSLWLLLVTLLALSSCKGDWEYYVKDTRPIATVIYPYTGLGDRSYVDKIYQGAERALLGNDVRIQHFIPTDIEETKTYLMHALQNDPGDGIRRLYIITESDIFGELSTYAELAPDDDMRQFVFMETRFTKNLVDSMSENPDLTYKELYSYLVSHTLGSHVGIFNAGLFGNLYRESPSEFFVYKEGE